MKRLFLSLRPLLAIAAAVAFFAAAALHFVPAVFEASIHSALAVDNGLLFLWLLVGFAAITALQSLADDLRSRWPMVLSWLVAFGWLFVPVADFRP